MLKRISLSFLLVEMETKLTLAEFSLVNLDALGQCDWMNSSGKRGNYEGLRGLSLYTLSLTRWAGCYKT